MYIRTCLIKSLPEACSYVHSHSHASADDKTQPSCELRQKHSADRAVGRTALDSHTDGTVIIKTHRVKGLIRANLSSATELAYSSPRQISARHGPTNEAKKLGVASSLHAKRAQAFIAHFTH